MPLPTRRSANLPWLKDPRYQEAMRLLQELLSERARGVQGVNPPDADRSLAYEAKLKKFADLRGGKLFFPYLSQGNGHGAWVELGDGSVKLDFITGIGVHGLGHNHPDLMKCGVMASMMDTVMQGNLQQTDFSVDLSDQLVKLASENGASLPHVMLTTSGAMANENALKLAFHHRPGSNRILAFEHCFAGRTLALSRVTDKASYRVGLPQTLNVDHLPFFDSGNPDSSCQLALQSLEKCLNRHPGEYGAIWIELIQGEGGYNVGDRRFFVDLLNRVRELNIPIIFDEVQTFGRTYRPFAFQHFGLDAYADIVTIGKISQVCGTFFSSQFKPGPGLVSQTFTGGTWEMLAAQVVLETLVNQGHFGDGGRNEVIFNRFASGLETLSNKYPGWVSGPWGLGGMIAMTPLQGTVAQAKRLTQICYEEGLICFLAGSEPARVRFLPPLAVVTDDQIDLGLAILERALLRLVEEESNA
ncbi:MAG: aminotransferase class III-fold pyridoxal phosphate-dependent enzyme [Planctomycetota bacterium]|nr:aminotransferase class III-fold pyridoxal phosphate-dependent enzyme [Planctomycetota bacterium]